MKKLLINLFIFLFVVATGGLLSNFHEAVSAQSQELSADRQADQRKRTKDVHSQDLKSKSKYDLRDIGGKKRGDAHNHGHDHKDAHVHGHKHGHGHDHKDAHVHDHGDGHKHGPGEAHHDHADDHHAEAEGHDHGRTGHDHGGHDHGHDHGHGGHEHGYDRLWHVGISG